MAYDNTIPANGHSASQDYNGIRGNFQQIQTSFSVDHQPLASGGRTEGYHKQIHLALQGVQPAPVDPVSIIYGLNGSGIQFSGHPIPFFINSVGSYPMIPDIIGSPGAGSFKIGPLI